MRKLDEAADAALKNACFDYKSVGGRQTVCSCGKTFTSPSCEDCKDVGYLAGFKAGAEWAAEKFYIKGYSDGQPWGEARTSELYDFDKVKAEMFGEEKQ